MIARTYKVRETDLARLKQLLQEAEAEVDELSEQELDLAERQLASSMQTLLSPPRSVPTLVLDRFPPRRKRRYAGGLALLAAAVTLMVLKPASEPEPVDVYVGSKGSEQSGIDCQSHWVQSDRSTPTLGLQGEVGVNPAFETYLRLSCSLPQAFVHVSFEENGQRVWLIKNAALSESGDFLEERQQLLDFSPALHRQLEVMVSRTALPETTFSHEENLSPEARQNIVWQDSFKLYAL